MIEALTEFEKQIRQKEQARHSNLLQQLRAELAAAKLEGIRPHQKGLRRASSSPYGR